MAMKEADHIIGKGTVIDGTEREGRQEGERKGTVHGMRRSGHRIFLVL